MLRGETWAVWVAGKLGSACLCTASFRCTEWLSSSLEWTEIALGKVSCPRETTSSLVKLNFSLKKKKVLQENYVAETCELNVEQKKASAPMWQVKAACAVLKAASWSAPSGWIQLELLLRCTQWDVLSVSVWLSSNWDYICCWYTVFVLFVPSNLSGQRQE